MIDWIVSGSPVAEIPASPEDRVWEAKRDELYVTYHQAVAELEKDPSDANLQKEAEAGQVYRKHLNTRPQRFKR